MFSKKIKKVINIEGMHCNHCAMSVTNALESIEGVSKVKVDLDKKQATITSSVEIDDKLIKEKIEELDFKVVE